MKRKAFLFCFLFLHHFITIHAQEQTLSLAIDFKNISFEEAKSLAKKSGKGIYMDVYATWCVPCKQFERNVFTDKEVGNKFNQWFVNLKIDAEKEEGRLIYKLYKVGGYPTGIFINSEGELLSKFEGVLPKANFISFGENALKMMDDPHGYDKAAALYAAQPKDKQVLQNLIQKSILSGNQIPPIAMDIYFSMVTPADFIADTVSLKKWIHATPTVIAGAETYSYFFKNSSFIKTNLNLDDAFLSSFFYNSLQTALQTAASKKAEAEMKQVLKLNSELPVNLRQSENIEYELEYYLERKDWNNYLHQMNQYCHATFDKIQVQKLKGTDNSALAARLNTFAWNYFLYTENKNELNYAAQLMEKCIELEPSFAAWYDTYAGIVYKMGDVSKALELEYRAYSLVQKNSIEQNIYRNKIERMKRGEKTWLPEQY